MKSMSMNLMVLVGSLTSLAMLVAPLRAGAYEPPRDPCSVLDQAEVSAALGASSTSGKHVVATLCEWDVAGQPAGSQGKKLTLGFLSAIAWEQTKALRLQMRQITRTPVEGLGEEAVFSTVGRF